MTPTEQLTEKTQNDYSDPAVRDAVRREWNRPNLYAEHKVIHDLLDALDGAGPTSKWSDDPEDCTRCLTSRRTCDYHLGRIAGERAIHPFGDDAMVMTFPPGQDRA